MTHVRDPVTGVSSRLNSATETPLMASMGANPAAGYTTDDVPTYTHRCGHTERELNSQGNVFDHCILHHT